MLLKQRDVVEVYFPFPDGVNSPHPVIVLSVQSVLNCEHTFIGIPISHSKEYNENKFSFPLYNHYFINRLIYENSHARLHLITNLRLSDVTNKKVLNEMKEEWFLRLFDEIQTSIFGCM